MGSKSKSSTATNTTSNYYDQREVNDNSGNSGIQGSGNAISLTTVDGGAIKAMSDVAMAQAGLSASIAETMRKSSETATDAALEAQNRALSSVDLNSTKAFDFATAQSKAAYASNAEALGLANKAADGLAAAYSAAAEQQNGNKTMTIAAVAAVGVVAALAVFSRKR